MRFVGIDIGGERHAVAVVKDDGALLVRSTLFGEEAAGYQRLHESPGRSARLLGSDGGNGALLAQFVRLPGWAWFQGGTPESVAHATAEEELERTKTDSVDALGIARFAAQKRPAPTPVSG